MSTCQVSCAWPHLEHHRPYRRPGLGIALLGHPYCEPPRYTRPRRGGCDRRRMYLSFLDIGVRCHRRWCCRMSRMSRGHGGERTTVRAQTGAAGPGPWAGDRGRGGCRFGVDDRRGCVSHVWSGRADGRGAVAGRTGGGCCGRLRQCGCFSPARRRLPHFGWDLHLRTPMSGALVGVHRGLGVCGR